MGKDKNNLEKFFLKNRYIKFKIDNKIINFLKKKINVFFKLRNFTNS
jgi:hypothetical protein